MSTDNLIIDDIIITSDRLEHVEAGWYIIHESVDDAIDPKVTAVLADSFESAEDAWISKWGHTLNLDEVTLKDYDGVDDPRLWHGSDDEGNYIFVDTSCIQGHGPIALTWKQL